MSSTLHLRPRHLNQLPGPKRYLSKATTMRVLFSLLALGLLLTTACNSQSKVATPDAKVTEGKMADGPAPVDYKLVLPAQEGQLEIIEKSADEWRAELTDQEYNVLREDGTERSFTSPLNDEKRAGVFTCAACGLPLFASKTKFKSGTGWPSFYEPIASTHIKQDEDFRYGMRRVEVSCARCDGHQGHVFPDGPDPTGLRYCINGVSLDFVPQEVYDKATMK